MKMLPHGKEIRVLVSKLIAEIDDSLLLLRGEQYLSPKLHTAISKAVPQDLLAQCFSITKKFEVTNIDPIRTIHHFACTGGTLISKCIAAMPNAQLLSEVDPLSVHEYGRPNFYPTDVIELLKKSSRGTSVDQIKTIFQSCLKTILADLSAQGLFLILRDHAHSHYCIGGCVPERPNLREIVREKFSVLSLVTVRDPIDSYNSLKANNWIQFSPANFNEYCRRYVTFLHAYADVPIVRYEDFVDEPQLIMKQICSILTLPFNTDFQDLFDVYKLTGDSGRSGPKISRRSRRQIDMALEEEIKFSDSYHELCELLGY